MDDGYESAFSEKEAVALALTDLLIQSPAQPDAELVAKLKAHFTDAEVAELMLAVSLFLSMSKVLITLGLEPDDMPVTVLPTPGSS